MPIPSRSDNLFNRRMTWFPAKYFFTFLGGSNEHCWISGAAAFFYHFEVLARHFLCSFNHFADAEALFAAQVEVVAFSALKQVFHGQYMGLGQVDDVDVVPDAGAVRGGVVGAVDGDVVPDTLGGFQDEGDQVGFGIVVLADVSALRSAGGVEVAERSVLEALGIGAVPHHVFNDQLCPAVYVGGVMGEIFHDGRLFRFPVDRGGGGEYDLVHSRLFHAFQQV